MHAWSLAKIWVMDSWVLMNEISPVDRVLAAFIVIWIYYLGYTVIGSQIC